MMEAVTLWRKVVWLWLALLLAGAPVLRAASLGGCLPARAACPMCAHTGNAASMRCMESRTTALHAGLVQARAAVLLRTEACVCQASASVAAQAQSSPRAKGFAGALVMGPVRGGPWLLAEARVRHAAARGSGLRRAQPVVFVPLRV